MDKLLYVAMSGAAQIDRAQTLHSNNLANVATTGFRADLAQARSVQVYGDGFKGRVYALTEQPGSDFKQGPLMETGRDLDTAISGAGFFAVRGSDGAEAYSRSGDFVVDALGALRDGAGREVLGEGGPISVPSYDALFIGADGSVTIQPEGQGPEALVQLDRLKLVKPERGELSKGEDGLLHTSAGAPLQSSPEVALVSGFLENSNVNAVNEMTSILELARQFELQVWLMKSAQDNDESATQLVRVN
ncbi:MAG: flagellar basal-body rod protein FlgF [Proteobacteria bacterium]|nr:flagellar basal-body rod protein FlgF [Pseudomonadota bacterium]